MKNLRKTVSLLLALVMLLTVMPLAGISASANERALKVGYNRFTGEFTPFFSNLAQDSDVCTMTSVNLLKTDREGAVVLLGKTGETRSYDGKEHTYHGPADVTITENGDGTYYYDFELRDDIYFSDGVNLTADDVIFTMYALADPTYYGEVMFRSLPILGMPEYRAGMESLSTLLYEAGKDNDDFTIWDEETQTRFWEQLDTAGAAFVLEIVDWCKTHGFADQDASISKAMEVWGYYLPDDATALDEFYAMVEAYDCDFVALSLYENAGSTLAQLGFEPGDYAHGILIGESADYIEGIQKTGDYSLRVVLTKFDVTAIYNFCIAIAPMHYYGDTAKYDYDNNMFGFEKGNLSPIRAKNAEPLGAGPYKFTGYTDGVVSFEANEHYYLGAPKISHVEFCETDEPDMLKGIIDGELDLADVSFSKDTADAIRQANSNGELTGDKFTTVTVDNLGYGYLGFSASVVNVGGDPGSEESRNLRKAIATVLARFREETVSDYYGDTAMVINYPISDTSWAAPRPHEEDYEIAFSKDIDGNDIYTPDMSADERTAAALNAALGYFEAAGYTVSEGRVVASPDDASMEYDVMVPGDGRGDHPCYQMAQLASDALASIGFSLIVADLPDATEIWSHLENNVANLWCAAWGAASDPDLYQVYYSGIGDGHPGGSNYMYDIADEELDELILEGRASSDIEFRRQIYKRCFDIILDWAVEIPVYQRQNATVFSTENVNLETVTPDISYCYGWLAEIENIELNNPYEPVEYPDVPDNAWYKEAAVYNAERGWITGYSNGNFGGADQLKRQDFVVILARIAGADLSAYEDVQSKMPDVIKGSYYAAAVNWAVDNGIIGGYTSGAKAGKFGVGDPITREQVCTILYRYMGSPAVENAAETLKPYTDAGRISSFAKDAVVWAIQNGVISGKNPTTLAPTVTASRAEIATIVMRMDKNGLFD